MMCTPPVRSSASEALIGRIGIDIGIGPAMANRSECTRNAATTVVKSEATTLHATLRFVGAVVGQELQSIL
jgi:2'-5' RNA ligase